MLDRPSSRAVGALSAGLVLGLVAGVLAGLLRAPKRPPLTAGPRG